MLFKILETFVSCRIGVFRFHIAPILTKQAGKYNRKLYLQLNFTIKHLKKQTEYEYFAGYQGCQTSSYIFCPVTFTSIKQGFKY